MTRGDPDEPDDEPGHGRSAPARWPHRQRRLAVGGLAALILVTVMAWGAVIYSEPDGRQTTAVPDYSGTGTGSVLVQVRDGQTGSEIAATLAQRDVVASTEAFLRASRARPGTRSIQPGYYQMRARMSGRAAVARILDPAARAGRLQVRGGIQLADVTQPDSSVTVGVLSRIARAACAQPDTARDSCVTADELRDTMAAVPPRRLGVPRWARDAAGQAQPSRTLEGLIPPGTYTIRPGAEPATLLRTVMRQSRPALAEAGLPGNARPTPFRPYEILIIASLIQREAIEADFAKVARVIYNRLEIGMALQMDSTINYPRQVQRLTTTDAERDAPGPYNTYRSPGLPPTPIGAASTEAITAALGPAEGEWTYFVKCRSSGASCFAETYDQHQDNIQTARQRDVF